MNRSTTKPSQARQRLIETADRLFYAEGIHVVGIDRIIAEAGVAKMTLYNHFASKDELLLEVLKQKEHSIERMFRSSIDRSARRGKDSLEAFFATLKRWFKSEDFRGCSFINATAELADSDHPAVRFSAEHKLRFYAMLRDCVIDAHGEPAAKAVPAIRLLIEGAIVSALIERSARPADVAKSAAIKLLS